MNRYQSTQKLFSYVLVCWMGSSRFEAVLDYSLLALKPEGMTERI